MSRVLRLTVKVAAGLAVAVIAAAIWASTQAKNPLEPAQPKPPVTIIIVGR